jgi:hypothetical protein
MAALVATWFYGAQILEGGYEILAFVRGDRPDIHQLTDSIASAEIRDAAYAAGEQWIAVTEAAERRQLPFGAASLLLGAAMVLLAARSMAGRDGSRRALVQVVAVHAGVLVAGFLLNQDVARAESAFQLRRAQGGNPAMTSTLVDPVARQGAEVGTRILEHALAPIGILMQTAVSSLIVIALTRPRARAFFREAASGPLGEG